MCCAVQCTGQSSPLTPITPQGQAAAQAKVLRGELGIICSKLLHAWRKMSADGLMKKGHNKDVRQSPAQTPLWQLPLASINTPNTYLLTCQPLLPPRPHSLLLPVSALHMHCSTSRRQTHCAHLCCNNACSHHRALSWCHHCCSTAPQVLHLSPLHPPWLPHLHPPLQHQYLPPSQHCVTTPALVTSISTVSQPRWPLPQPPLSVQYQSIHYSLPLSCLNPLATAS